MIKIENRAFPDAARVGYGGKLSHSFVAGSRNKRSLGVNLRTPEGVDLLKRLVAGADVVLENFKPGTLEKLGLGYEALRAVKPDLVMLSTNALGSTGPWSRWLGYGPIVRCVSGVASLWRYPDDELGFGEPTTIYPDHYGARVCATAVLAALIRRRRTAAGAYLESAQAEIIVNQLADVFLAASLGAEPDEPGAPWGVYPCAGDDEWCVITVSDDEQWRALRWALGAPEWAAAGAFDSAAERIANRELLDRHLAEWTRTLPPRAVMERLQAAGVPAAMMMRPDDHERDPHLRLARRLPRAAPARPRRRAAGGRPVPLARHPAGPRQPGAAARRAHARDLRRRCWACRRRRSRRCSRPACSRSRCSRKRWRHDGPDRDRRARHDRDGQGLRPHRHGLRRRGARARARRRRAGQGRRRRPADQRQPLGRDGADAADVARPRGPDARQCDERLRLQRRDDAAVRRARDHDGAGERRRLPVRRRAAGRRRLGLAVVQRARDRVRHRLLESALRLRRLRAGEHELRARLPPAHAPVRHDARPARDDRRRPARSGRS